MFHNRSEAGQLLGRKLESLNTPETVLLAIPRGGIEVAYPIAILLKKPMDVVIPRKVTFPDNPELAIGAVTFDGGVEINHVLADKLRLTPADVEQLALPARLEIERRLKLYRGARPGPQLGGRDIILIDDGLATGYTMQAAAKSVLREHPRRVVVAVPVSPASTCEHLGSLVDQVVVLHLAQESFFAVGSFYDDFNDQPENELIRMLSESHAPAQRSAQSGI